MERANLKKILSMIKGIEKKTSEMESFLLNLPILSRKKMLKQIYGDTLKNNKYLQESALSKEKVSKIEGNKDSLLIENIIDKIISNIKEKPSKKVIYLKEFLKFFQEISANDKNVILQSLKDKDPTELEKQMASLTKIFNLKL
jgi:hypothetical protein